MKFVTFANYFAVVDFELLVAASSILLIMCCVKYSII